MIDNHHSYEYPIKAVTIEKFAELFCKTNNAVRMMVKRKRLPVLVCKSTEQKGNRASEILIHLVEFNRQIDAAYYSSPEKERDSWINFLKRNKSE